MLEFTNGNWMHKYDQPTGKIKKINVVGAWYVNIAELDMYCGDGKKVQKDEFGKVGPEFE